MNFGVQVEQDIRAHALREYPNECCGFVVDGVYRPMKNDAEDPKREFVISGSAYLEFVDRLQAVVHSHVLPGQNPWPSRQDMEAQLSVNVPFGIVTCDGTACPELFWWGDGVPVPPWEGRQFRPGVADCYSIIRHWYQVELGVRLPEYPRDHDWWRVGGNLYTDNFARAGFRVVDPSEAKPNDVLLARVLSRVINHGAVYLGGGLMLHHLSNNLSIREPVGRYGGLFGKVIQAVLRYEG